MVYITFYHGRNIFRGHEFASWVKNFPSANFEGFECGNYFPKISIPLAEFEAAKEVIPTQNIVRMEGEFSILQQLVFGVRNFKNDVSDRIESARIEFS